VGGTSGIGLYTAREFVRYTISPHVYLVGRNEVEAKRTIDELHSLNPDGKVQFIKSDVSLLKGVDKACDEILRTADRVNLLFLSCGMMSTGGRDGMFDLLSHHQSCPHTMVDFYWICC
jgi:NAD(P)-dependent dehydrogenase (short-subunit alcohol dehydrogenase family)